jgi:hypothetical protein
MRPYRLAPGNPVCTWLFPLLIAAIGLSGCEKARLDDEVRRLCAVDGGIKVYETVILPPERFDKYGVVLIPSKEKVSAADEYFYEWEVQYIKNGNPQLSKSHHRFIRVSDGKLLGESIRYTRRGGDIPGPWHASSFTCPELTEHPSLEQTIFKKQVIND